MSQVVSHSADVADDSRWRGTTSSASAWPTKRFDCAVRGELQEQKGPATSDSAISVIPIVGRRTYWNLVLVQQHRYHHVCYDLDPPFRGPPI
jgi:hypothetical protein